MLGRGREYSRTALPEELHNFLARSSTHGESFYSIFALFRRRLLFRLCSLRAIRCSFNQPWTSVDSVSALLQLRQEGFKSLCRSDSRSQNMLNESSCRHSLSLFSLPDFLFDFLFGSTCFPRVCILRGTFRC